MPEVTASLAKFISTLTLDSVPEEVVHEARRYFLDTLGCAIAGSRSELGEEVRVLASLLGHGSEASVAGAGKRFTSLAASYGNGRFANCLDLDETYPGGPVAGLHFGASVFGQALSMCEQQGATTRELLLAIICGYEAAGRISDVGTQMGIDRGRFTSMPEVWGLSLAPTVGAAVAASRLLGQDAGRLEHTLAVAASNAATPTGPIWSRQTELPQCFDAGWAAMTGGFAARAVENGLRGIPGVFDGTPSIFTMVGTRLVDHDGLIGEFGSRWALTNIVYKPWPSCRFHHSALSGLLKLQRREGFDAESVDEIIIGVNKSRLAGRFFNAQPATFVARQFSFPHSIAMLLLGVPPGPDWAARKWDSNPLASKLRSKVKFEDYARAATSPEYFVRGQYRQLPCSIEVRFGGRAVREEVDFAMGDPWTQETAFTDGDIATKFRTVTGLPTALAEEVVDTVMHEQPGASLSPVFEALAAAKPEPGR